LSNMHCSNNMAWKANPIRWYALPCYMQGNIVEWKKKEGDELASGDILCMVETDKVMRADCLAGTEVLHVLCMQDPLMAVLHAFPTKNACKSFPALEKGLTREPCTLSAPDNQQGGVWPNKEIDTGEPVQ